MAISYASKIRLLDPATPEFTAPSTSRWYLAYGSNLCSSVFIKRRGIIPLAKEVVLAKGIELVFDQEGFPYAEPRFANSRLSSEPDVEFHPEKEWTGRGGLIGVAYLVSASDFRKILATEGAGSSYQPLEVYANVITEEGVVSGETKRVYTLQSQTTRQVKGEPSLRYMTLIRNGAREHALPASYIRYLDSLPHYQPNTLRQQIGRIIYISMSVPALFICFRVMAHTSDTDGRTAPWAAKMMSGLVRVVWGSYDWVGRYVFGNAEVTEEGKRPYQV